MRVHCHLIGSVTRLFNIITYQNVLCTWLRVHCHLIGSVTRLFNIITYQNVLCTSLRVHCHLIGSVTRLFNIFTYQNVLCTSLRVHCHLIGSVTRLFNVVNRPLRVKINQTWVRGLVARQWYARSSKITSVNTWPISTTITIGNIVDCIFQLLNKNMPCISLNIQEHFVHAEYNIYLMAISHQELQI